MKTPEGVSRPPPGPTEVNGPAAAAVPPVPDSLAAVVAPVEARMRTLLDAETLRWSLVDDDLLQPLAALSDFALGGGKRLRPAFCHWAYVGSGGDPDDPRVVDAGAALELLHTFALVHDDVMDGSPLRRGRTTVHLDFASRHLVAGWRGEARRFGEGVAILIGDLAFVYADILMGGASPAVAEVFNQLRLELNIGQYLDMVGTAAGRSDHATARRIACYKSGKYTVERPLHLGAALAGRLDDLGPALSAYGLPLGEAFQLRDDLLGVFGEPAVTGKPVGDDLRDGKPTPLLAIATARAGPHDRALLDRVGAGDLTDAEVADLQALLVDTGAKDETERQVEVLLAEALAALNESPLNPESRHALTELATYVAHRDR
ncbi:MAG: polyprenyl synthetase family protein [Actinomycetota bacterium]|nr:polyprenyl synthetase family protein [Actinomycetota bacterium]